MRIYALSSVVSRPKDLRTYRATWPYHLFFHGDISPRGAMNRYGERPYESTRLIKNTRLLAEVTFPPIWMVVRQTIADHLRQFADVDLVPCVWERVCDQPVDEQAIRALTARYSVFDDEGYNRWERRTFKQPKRDFVGPLHFQVLAPNLKLLRASFQCREYCELPSPLYEEMPPLSTCAELHARYPVLRLAPYYLFSEDAFAPLLPHVIDPDLFTVVPVELG